MARRAGTCEKWQYQVVEVRVDWARVEKVAEFTLRGAVVLAVVVGWDGSAGLIMSVYS